MSCQVPVKFTLTPVGIQNLNTGKGIGAAALPPALWSPPQNLGAVFGYHPDRHALYAWVPPSPRVRCRQAFFTHVQYRYLLTWTLPRSSQVYTKTTDNQTEVTSTPFKHMLWWKGVNVT